MENKQYRYIPRYTITTTQEVRELLEKEIEAENKKAGIRLYNMSTMVEYLIKLGLQAKNEGGLRNENNR